MQNESTYLNGRLKIITSPREMKMSHWVYAPRVVDVRQGSIILDLTDSLWDLRRVVESENNITLVIRKYPGSAPESNLQINPDEPAFLFNGKPLSASALAAELDRY